MVFREYYRAHITGEWRGDNLGKKDFMGQNLFLLVGSDSLRQK